MAKKQSLPWSEAITDFHIKQQKWKYFDLINPPEQGKQKMWYEQTQSAIESEIEDFIQKIQQERTITDEENVSIFLEDKRKKSIEKEEQIFKNISKKLGLNLDYNTLVEADKHYHGNETISIGFGKTAPLIKNSISFWTALSLGFLDGNLQSLNSEQAFTLLLGSKELYDVMKGKIGYDYFSRTKLLQPNKSAGQGGYGELVDTKLQQEIFDQFDQITKESLYLDGYEVTEEIFNQVKEVLEGYKSFRKKRQKTVSATAFSENLRQKLQSSLNQLLPKKDYRLEIKNGDSVFLTVSGDIFLSEGANILYKNKKNIKGDKTLQTLIESTRLGLEEGIKKVFSGNVNTLNLLSLGKIDLSIFGGAKDIENKSLDFLNKDKFYSIISKLGTKEHLQKAFNAGNNNAYVSGLFGELRAALVMGTNFLSNLKMTGNMWSEIPGGKKLGESPHDLMTSGTNNWGAQVKHYILNSNETLTLYKDDKLSDIDRSGMEKYFTFEDQELLKFISANAPFIDKYSNENPKELVRSIAITRIGAFLRFYDQAGKTELGNLFYMINNVVYPASYIYQIAINQVKDLIKKNNDKGFFTIKGQKIQSSTRTQYKNRDSAFKDWNKEKYLLENNIFGKSKIQIKTNGLKVNLMRFNII